jgi:hypothetical protein
VKRLDLFSTAPIKSQLLCPADKNTIDAGGSAIGLAFRPSSGARSNDPESAAGRTMNFGRRAGTQVLVHRA